MTRSLANCEADGGTIDKPGGGRFLDEDGVLREPNRFDSEGLMPSGPSPLAVFCRRDSIIDLCWSLTEMLR